LRGLIASRETALELERKRIAREVHDELGQLLTGLQMKVSRLARNCAGNRPALCVQMHEALQLSEKALSVARNVASALRPAVLDMGIVTALEWLVDRFGINTGVHCQLHIAKGYLQLNESQSTALFRITQESLTNVARHAQADRVDIVLHKTAQEYVLKIRDNGVGFNRTIKKVGTFGLVGIHERVLMLGGEVDVNSGLEKGTEIVVRLPIEERQETL
jgi:signal transduction histidine kinase